METHRILTPDGVALHVEEVGSGPPVLFVHEFAGDHRSFEPQIRRLARRHRCIVYAARGYLPSDVPTDPSAYSQDHAVADALAVLDGLEIATAHVVGVSMGGFCALHLGLAHPDRVRSVLAGGVGYGAAAEAREPFRRECDVIADAFETQGAHEFAKQYGYGAARIQFQTKDPRGHLEFATQLGEHSTLGSTLTMRGFQRERPSLYDFEQQFNASQVPTLIVTGDEDDGCLDTSLWLKRAIPTAGLAVLPRSGHTLPLEEPERFNQLLGDFLADVELGAWHPRDPRTRSKSATGMAED